MKFSLLAFCLISTLLSLVESKIINYNESRLIRQKRDTNKMFDSAKKFVSELATTKNLGKLLDAAGGLIDRISIIQSILGLGEDPNEKLEMLINQVLDKLDDISNKLDIINSQVKCEGTKTPYVENRFRIKNMQKQFIQYELSDFNGKKKKMSSLCNSNSDGIEKIHNNFQTFIEEHLERIYIECARYKFEGVVYWSKMIMIQMVEISTLIKGCTELIDTRVDFNYQQFNSDVRKQLEYMNEIFLREKFVKDELRNSVKILIEKIEKTEEAIEKLNNEYSFFIWNVILYDSSIHGDESHQVYFGPSSFCGSVFYLRELKNDCNALVSWCIINDKNRNQIDHIYNHLPKFPIDSRAKDVQIKLLDMFKNEFDINYILALYPKDSCPSSPGESNQKSIDIITSTRTAIGGNTAGGVIYGNSKSIRKMCLYVSTCVYEISQYPREKPRFSPKSGLFLPGSEYVDKVNYANTMSSGSSTHKVISERCNRRIVGYFPSWGENEFRVEQARKLTHAIFAFYETFADGSVRLGSADPNRKTESDVLVSRKRLENFKKVCSEANIKTLFAVGGWENSQYFSSICSDPAKRSIFISSLVDIIITEGFDGVDIDWEHPVTGGAVEGIPQDKENYVQMMRELRMTLDELKTNENLFWIKVEHSGYLITFAGAAGDWTLTPGYDLPGLLKYADWVNVMTYDYFGAWDSKWGAYTGPPAPLFFGNPKGYSGKVNADWTIRYYVCKSKQPQKIVMGVPFYGRYWNNVGDPVDPEYGMWRKADSTNGKFSGGYVPWYKIKSDYITNPNFKIEIQKFAQTPYAWNENDKIFLGFENPESLEFKVRYAEHYNLGGMMIWAVDQDDDIDSMLNVVSNANLCRIEDHNEIVHRCLPIEEKRWWTPEDGEDKAGMCGKSAPLYKGYYPICDPEDPGYKCCGSAGYCGSGPDYCNCPTCVDYSNYAYILQEPIKPTVKVNWYFLNAEDGKRGRCGRGIPLLDGKIPTCNPDDPNAHCCSNGGYCGSGDEYCKCEKCVDFKENPNYVYKEKTWLDLSDGADLSGKCGPSAPRINGNIAECDPESNYYCCSKYGSCGSGEDFCDCEECINYKL